jgi:light-independent protochlorophyllide reductase subunit B
MRLDYWMYQGTAHHGVARITNSLRGVFGVFHAPQGDDYINSIFTMLERTPDFPRMTTSVVSGRDLAQGTISLPLTLREVDAQFHPELIVVSTTCSTTLLQEDLQRVADNAGVNAKVIIFDANPYRMQEVVAAEGVFTLLVKQLASAQLPTPQPSVNILGPASLGFHVRSDLICLRRMMAALGVRVNVIAPWGASLDDLKRLPAAWVNVAPYRELGQGAAAHLHEQFGMPIITDAPIGVKATRAWLRDLVQQLNEVGASIGGPQVKMPPLTAFSLDGLSAPSSVPWFTRTADMESFSNKRAYVFGDATRTVGVTRFLRDELDMQIASVGTYLPQEADWMRGQLDGYLPGDLFVSDQFQEVARQIDAALPDVVCGTQMERHSCRKLGMECMVIAPPTHIENHLLSYRPILGFEGADYLADTVYTTVKLGMEKHLIDLFGDAGLEYESSKKTSDFSEKSDVSTTQMTPLTPATLTTDVPAANCVEAVQWSPEAERMLGKVPFFVRKKARRNVEKYAAEHGHATITAEVLQVAKEAIGG